MSLQTFFTSSLGQVVVVLAIALLLCGVLISGREKKTDAKVLAASAVLVALAVVLKQIKLFPMPQGGDVSAFGMLPIALCAYFFGVRRGVMAGMCVGLADLMFSPYAVSYTHLIIKEGKRQNGSCWQQAERQRPTWEPQETAICLSLIHILCC